MACVHHNFQIRTADHNQVVDITERVRQIVSDSGVTDGLCSVFTAHATAAIMINENDDPNIGTDFLTALKKLIIEHDNWLHDRIDNNAAAHIKSALIGPSEIVPIIRGQLTLGRWQNIFLCEFDGPRDRKLVVTILS